MRARMTGAVAVGTMAAMMAIASPTGSGSAAAAAAPGPKPEAVTATALPKTQVKVEAWNLYQLPDILNVFAGDQAGPKARAADALQRLKNSDADILALSEVNGKNGKKILEELREEYPYQTVRLADSCVGVHGACSNAPWSVNGGVAILSKFPIADTQQYVYRNYSALAPDAFANKGAVLARIDKDGEQFWVVATHTQADDTIDDAAARTHVLRSRQAQELRNFVETFVPAGAPVIYGGDFNVEYFRGLSKRDAQGRNEFEQIKDRSGINLFDPAKLPFTFDSKLNPLVRPIGYRDTLDYLGTSGTAQISGVTVPGLGANPASDHNPVAGTAVLTGYTGTVPRSLADPGLLNATPFERITYFVYDAATTAYRMVVMAVEKVVAKVSALFDRGIGPHPVTAGSSDATSSTSTNGVSAEAALATAASSASNATAASSASSAAADDATASESTVSRSRAARSAGDDPDTGTSGPAGIEPTAVSAPARVQAPADSDAGIAGSAGIDPSSAPAGEPATEKATAKVDQPSGKAATETVTSSAADGGAPKQATTPSAESAAPSAESAAPSKTVATGSTGSTESAGADEPVTPGAAQ